MMKSKLQIIGIAVLFVCYFPSVAVAQEIDDPAMAAQNPLANVISLPFQNNTSFGYGEYNKTGNVLYIQADKCETIIELFVEEDRIRITLL